MPTLTLTVPWLDSHAKNMALPIGLRLIIMRRGVPQRAAIWAQERYEAERKDSPKEWLAYVRSADVRRFTRLMAGEIEVQVAVWLYGDDEEAKRRREAKGLATYPDFIGVHTARMIETHMLGLRDAAKQWMDEHGGEIRRRK